MVGIKQKVVKGIAWTFLEKIATIGARFVVSMVLARLLTPDDYGTVALLGIFLSVAGVLVDSGFGKALIQKKDATDLDFNSVFYLGMLVAFVLYCILFLAAPLIAEFYSLPELTDIFRVLALGIIFNVFSGIQDAELTRRMLFNLSFRITVIINVVSAVVGILLAYMGWGPWALVWSSIISGFCGVIVRWIIIAWRPRLMFSWNAVAGLFNYGWRMALSSLLETLINQITSLIVGKFYSKADLAYVNRGQSIGMLPMDIINSSLLRATFPAMSKMQNNEEKLREAMRRVIRCSSFLVFPLMVGCGCCADEIVYILYGSQWGGSVPYIRLFCFGFALWPIHTANLNALAATGRSDIYLRYSLIKKALTVVSTLAAIPFGVWWMVAISTLVLGPVSIVINILPNRKLIGYRFRMFISDILPCVVACVVMLCAVVSLRLVLPPTGLYIPKMVGLLVCEAIVGMSVYFGISHYCRLQAYQEYITIMLPTIRKIKGRLL